MIDKICELIVRKGYTQVAIERSCKLPENRISKWKDGKGVPTGPQLWRIAKALEVSMEYLADDDLDQPPEPLSRGQREILIIVEKLGERAAIDRLLGTHLPFKVAGAASWDDTVERIERRSSDQQGGAVIDKNPLPASKSRKSR